MAKMCEHLRGEGLAFNKSFILLWNGCVTLHYLLPLKWLFSNWGIFYNSYTPQNINVLKDKERLTVPSQRRVKSDNWMQHVIQSFSVSIKDINGTIDEIWTESGC